MADLKIYMKDLKRVLELNKEINYEKPEDVKKVHKWALSKGIFKSDLGKSFTDGLQSILDKDKTKKCIVCGRDLDNDTLVCRDCQQNALVRLQEQIRDEKEAESEKAAKEAFEAEKNTSASSNAAAGNDASESSASDNDTRGISTTGEGKDTADKANGGSDRDKSSASEVIDQPRSSSVSEKLQKELMQSDRESMKAAGNNGLGSKAPLAGAIVALLFIVLIVGAVVFIKGANDRSQKSAENAVTPAPNASTAEVKAGSSSDSASSADTVVNGSYMTKFEGKVPKKDFISVLGETKEKVEDTYGKPDSGDYVYVYNKGFSYIIKGSGLTATFVSLDSGKGSLLGIKIGDSLSNADKSLRELGASPASANTEDSIVQYTTDDLTIDVLVDDKNKVYSLNATITSSLE